MSKRLDDWADEHDHTERDLREAGAPESSRKLNLPTSYIYLTDGVTTTAFPAGTKLHGFRVDGIVVVWGMSGDQYGVVSTRCGRTIRAYTVEEKEE